VALSSSQVQAQLIGVLEATPLHLDASRLAVVRGSLNHCTGYRRLLLGRNGVGKSILLAHLMNGAHGLL
jgi:ABC-type branched-subunit amino acid transport system ATPase component